MAVRGSHGAGPRALAAHARPAPSLTRWGMHRAPGEGVAVLCFVYFWSFWRFGGGGLGALGFGFVKGERSRRW